MPQKFVVEVLDSEPPVLVYFYTDQRQPCRIVSPLIEEIEDECAGSLKAVKIDAATE